VEKLDSLIEAVREVCAALPDKRRGRNCHFTMADIGMAAFSVFFMQSPSFLAHQRQLLKGQGRSNCHTLFKMTDIPCDNHIRAMLDPVEPSLFHPVFEQAVRTLEAGGGLAALRCLSDHVLIALDGTQYHRSAKVHCPRCSTVTKGKNTEYFHSMVQAALVAPAHNRAVPLQPAFIEPQDGSEKQDCESRACRRWLAQHGATYAHLNPIYLGDDLYSCQPICEAVHAAKGHFLFVCKPDSHPTLTEYLTGVELDERIETVKRGKQRFRYTYRWICDLPLRDGKDALHINWLSIEIADPNDRVTYRNSFVTDLAVDRDNVVELAACGRARWKVENETFNTLKTKGYNLEHNFGHGHNNLAAVLVILNLLAFACHTVADLADDLWQRARAESHTRVGFFNHLRSITVFVVFPSWDDLLATIAFDKPLTRPP
jgi:hypothetical protein